MKFKLLTVISLSVIGQILFSQEKIKADLKTINFLGRDPYKTEKNTLVDNLLKILYYLIKMSYINF